MITKRIQGDINQTPLEHIAFHARPQGQQFSGFASTFSKTEWPELFETSIEMGTVLSKKLRGKTYHAIIAWKSFGNYTDCDKLYLEGLNSITGVDKIASITPGAEDLGMDKVQHITDAIEACNKEVWIYYL